MVQVPDELLMAYADGELTPPEAKALDALLSQDPALRDRLTPFIETRIRLSTAFEHKLHEPVPDRLIAAIARAAVAEQARRRAPSFVERAREVLRTLVDAILPDGRLTPALAGTAAALLVFGMATGWLIGHVGGSGLIHVAGSGLVASGTLADVLESKPSGLMSDADWKNTSIVPVLSFRDQNNSVCREYRIMRRDDGPDSAGLACRAPDGTWRVALHVETPKQPQTGGTYQTATAANVPAVDTLIEETISGDAFGKDDETALLKNGWQLPPASEQPARVPGN